MKSFTLVIVATVSAGVLLVAFWYLALFTTVLKKELSFAQATSLSSEYLQLASADVDALSTKLADFSSVETGGVRSMIEESGFRDPNNVAVSRVENHVRIGGLDEKSITNVNGSYTCGESTWESHFSMQFMYEDSTWKLSDFYVTGCQKQLL